MPGSPQVLTKAAIVILVLVFIVSLFMLNNAQNSNGSLQNKVANLESQNTQLQSRNSTLVNLLNYLKGHCYRPLSIQAQCFIATAQLSTINLTITNYASYQATAIVEPSENTTLDIQPSQQEITLQSGQAGQVKFSVIGLSVQVPTYDNVTFQTINGVGVVTDTQSVGIVVLPCSAIFPC